MLLIFHDHFRRAISQRLSGNQGSPSWFGLAVLRALQPGADEQRVERDDSADDECNYVFHVFELVCFVEGKSGGATRVCSLSSRQSGHGWPQRSHRQACASATGLASSAAAIGT
jgi:hypothetical protein